MISLFLVLIIDVFLIFYRLNEADYENNVFRRVMSHFTGVLLLTGKMYVI